MEKVEHTSNISETPKNFNLTVNLNQLESLRKFGQSLPNEHKRLFRNKYGRILDFLDISVDVQAITVLAQYWSPSLRCFEFPEIDLTPTIEEYSCMLGLPMREDSTVYFHADHYSSDAKLTEQITELLDLQPKQLKWGGPNSQGLTRSFLETLMSNMVKREEWRTLSRILALTIYGLVLFPSALNIVDRAAIDVFFTVETKGRNLVPALLAETFLTLIFCQQKRKGKIRCCVQLLYVWIATHLFAGSHIDRSTSPLKGLKAIHMKPRNEHDWRIEFEEAGKELFRRICSWLEQVRNEEVIFNCGEFPNVPLMGPRGCIAYTPAVVMKQLGRTQYEPLKEQIGGCYFWYKNDDDTRTLSKKVREAWMFVHRKGEAQLGKPLLADSPEYKAWRKARKMMSSASGPSFRKDEDGSQSVSEIAKQIEILKAQNYALREQKEDAYLKAEAIEKKNDDLTQELEGIKSRRVDVAGTSKTRKGKEKVSEAFFGKVRKLENKTQLLFEENSKLKRELNQQGKIIEDYEVEIDQQNRIRKKLKRAIAIQKKEMEQKIECLNVALENAQFNQDQAMKAYQRYKDLFVRAANMAKTWIDEASTREAVVGTQGNTRRGVE